MDVQVYYGGVERTDALANHIERQVEHATRHVADHFTRLDVHLHLNGAHRTANEMRCTLEARPRGGEPFAVEESNFDMYRAVTSAGKTFERTAKRWLERHDRTS